jgi:septation ring formation regulator EzrA
MTKAKKAQQAMDSWLRRRAAHEVKEAAECVEMAESDLEQAREDLETAIQQHRAVVRKTSEGAKTNG